MRLKIDLFILPVKGPAIGSALYSLGGFTLPFLSCGILGLVMGICLLFSVPKIDTNTKEENDNITCIEKGKTLTWKDIVTVTTYYI